MSFSINGKTAIITGAANGIGLAIARQFADAGANVMCADIDEESLREELGEPSDDSNVRFFAGDLRKRLTVANLVSATIDAFEQVDILVNASRQVLLSDVLDSDDDTVQQLLDQNLFTALNLSRQVARRMVQQAEEQPEGQVGSIINFSSITAQRTRPELMGYSISAAAIEQMTRNMALELAPHRIRVNAISIGSVMSHSLKLILADHRDWRDEIRGHTPLGRLAAPSEVTDTVQFLAAESSSFMTGEILHVDGGRSVKDAVQAPAH